MNALQRINPKWVVAAILLFFACIYASISLYNHYNFRTFAFDLGIKNQALWDYAHGRMNYNTIMPELNGKINIFANHFEPVIILFAPLYYIFGNYTLLVVQIGCILLGGYGAYKYVAEISGDRLFAATALAMFYGMWGIFAALSFDFHTNVIGAVMLPWIFYAIERKKNLVGILTLLFILFCKENMAIWMVFVGLGIFLHWRKDKKRRTAGLFISAISLVYFIGVMKFAMPYFSDGKLPYLHFKYSSLGNSWTEALQTVFTRPGYTFRLLFENQFPGKILLNDHTKMEFHLYLLLSGGFLLLFRPQFLVMLIPIYAQKMFSDDPMKWGIFHQYSIEFVPVIVLAVFTFLNKATNPVVKILAGLLFFLAAFDTAKEFSGLWKHLPYGKELTNFYQPSHYKREIDRGEIRQLIKALPDDASVSTTFYVLPHIADRKEVYQFPNIQQAAYILTVDDGTYNNPLDSNTYQPTLDSILNTGAWETTLQTPHGYLLKRK